MERREITAEAQSSGARQPAAASAFGTVAFALLFAFAALMLATVLAPSRAYAAGSQDMYRLYNPNSGEHFYTASVEERDYLDNIGWNYEGVGWVASASSNTPVYRLYNPNVDPATGSGEHHYTMSAEERDMLVAAGWNDEGIGWYSSDARSVPIYRQYNSNAFNCNHNYSTSVDENNSLSRIGWNVEGVAWYGEGGALADGYSCRLESVVVSIPVNPYGTTGQRVTLIWQYPQIEYAGYSAAVEKINAAVSQAVLSNAAFMNAYPDSGMSNLIGAATFDKTLSVSYLGNGYVCIRDEYYSTNWGPHGEDYIWGTIYSLSTGNVVEPYAYLGITSAQLSTKTKNAVRTYLKSNPSDLYTASKALTNIEDAMVARGKAFYQLDGASRYYVSANGGLVFVPAAYDLGSYAWNSGWREIPL